MSDRIRVDVDLPDLEEWCETCGGSGKGGTWEDGERVPPYTACESFKGEGMNMVIRMELTRDQLKTIVGCLLGYGAPGARMDVTALNACSDAYRAVREAVVPAYMTQEEFVGMTGEDE